MDFRQEFPACEEESLSTVCVWAYFNNLPDRIRQIQASEIAMEALFFAREEVPEELNRRTKQTVAMTEVTAEMNQSMSVP